jgi:hypothetical protein
VRLGKEADFIGRGALAAGLLVEPRGDRHDRVLGAA